MPAISVSSTPGLIEFHNQIEVKCYCGLVIRRPVAWMLLSDLCEERALATFVCV